VLSTALLGLLLAADASGPIRLLLAFWFLFFCPGLAVVPLLSMRSLGEELVLAFVLSIIVDTIVATTILLVAELSTASGFITLAVLCLIGCVLQVLRPFDLGGRPLVSTSTDPEPEAWS
jgi:hypothetical protein